MFLALHAAVPGYARDAYVLLSGGGTPLTNNYSQYLQAQAMANHLQATYPADSVWVFFGQGNRPGEKPVLADVRKQVKEKGVLRETWLPGVLKNNRRARKADFLTALRDEILPAVHEGGTLYLFIGDHGSLAKEEPKESVVTMWQMNPGRDGKSWRSDPKEELSVTDLREALAAGLGRGRVVFCMTQCHSGGFHFLGIPREVGPNPDWFEAMVPDWAIPADEQSFPLAAGFTAVDEASLAAGCDPDPDPDRWAGYERFVPEKLLGIDLFTGAKSGQALASYAAAHEQAVLVDQTIDKPRSTSEQFLERWAETIEKLAAEKNLTPLVSEQVRAYQQAVEHGLAEAPGADFAARRAQFAKFIERMAEQNSRVAVLLRQGPRDELEQSIGPAEHGGSGGGGRRGPPADRLKPWTETVRPAWKFAVETGTGPKMSRHALAFEKYLLAQEDKGRNLMFAGGWQNPILNDLYWQSSYAIPDKLNKKKAEDVTRWGAERRTKIIEWAKASPDAAVREAAEKLWSQRATTSGNFTAPPRTLSRKIAAERTLFYRRTLAAWAFLIAVNHTPALDELQRLIALENTVLPAPARR